jgi:hypothetical protein
LPSFPQANAASKFSDLEVIGLMEFALPAAWRKAFDLKGYVPADEDKARLVDECERIEHHETPIAQAKDNDDSNNIQKFRRQQKKMKTKKPREEDSIFVRSAGLTPRTRLSVVLF